MCGDIRKFAAQETDRAIELAAALAGQETLSAPEETDRGEVNQRGAKENHGDTEARREEGRSDRGKEGRGESLCLRSFPTSSMVVKRLRWRAPADNAFSEAGQAKLRALCERADVGRIWNWINGRRTAEEIWERAQFDGAVPYDVVTEYLELLVAEGFTARVGL